MARLLIVGAGVFGRLAADEARRRGHEPVVVHRRGRLRTNASDAASVAATIRTVRAEAVLLAAGPARTLAPGAAEAAHRLALPYADIAEEPAFHMRVKELGEGSPLLTGMSTTPALAEALAALALARAPQADAVRAVLFAQAGNPRGPATLAFAARSRVAGPPATLDVPGFGRRRVWPARAAFTPGTSREARFYVGLTGLGGVGWRFARVPGLRFAARLVPAFGGTGATFVADALGEDGQVLARASIHAARASQRMAVLPAIWALEEAFAGRAPRCAALPAEWVDAGRLVRFVEHEVARLV